MYPPLTAQPLFVAEPGTQPVDRFLSDTDGCRNDAVQYTMILHIAKSLHNVEQKSDYELAKHPVSDPHGQDMGCVPVGILGENFPRHGGTAYYCEISYSFHFLWAAAWCPLSSVADPKNTIYMYIYMCVCVRAWVYSIQMDRDIAIYTCKCMLIIKRILIYQEMSYTYSTRICNFEYYFTGE